ncbi:MAG TPA: HPr family phosphocarrier protein [Planctomycetota bacterium]|nr:HPr family phosphocarrier protein [Planctomycetota bacterium]
MLQTQPNVGASTPTWLEEEVEVPNPQGIHARPAMLIAKTAGAFKAQVALGRNDVSVNAKSTIHVLTLVAEQGARLVVRACGEDAREAVEALVALVRGGFDEM